MHALKRKCENFQMFKSKLLHKFLQTYYLGQVSDHKWIIRILPHTGALFIHGLILLRNLAFSTDVLAARRRGLSMIRAGNYLLL